MPKRRYFVQARPGEAWHVETDEDCEWMLCGYFISVEGEQQKIQGRWGVRKCPDCWLILRREDQEAAGAAPDA